MSVRCWINEMNTSMFDAKTPYIIRSLLLQTWVSAEDWAMIWLCVRYIYI